MNDDTSTIGAGSGDITPEWITPGWSDQDFNPIEDILNDFPDNIFDPVNRG